MAITYSYMTTEEMRQIDPDLIVRETTGDPIFDLFPVVSTQADRLVWEQRDNYKGLQQVRGLNGEPRRVKQVGRGKFSMEPGVYGEYMDVDEAEMTRRASPTSTGMPVDISDLVAERQQQLLARQTNRMRWLLWELVVNGRFAVLNEAGAVTHADAYDQQVYTASVAWATSATATPIANFRAVSRLTRGTSNSMGANATAYMNQTTFDALLTNTNAADLGGKIVTNRDQPRDEIEINEVLVGYGIPRVRVFDDGYIDDANTFTYWIPDSKVVVVGARTNGARLGEMRMTRNVQNGDGAAGAYYDVIDTIGIKGPPRKIEVHRGWNGGPALFHPGSICVMNV